jgi:hypothetical protein
MRAVETRAFRTGGKTHFIFITFAIEPSSLEQIMFITEDTKVKHKNITLFTMIINIKYLQKLLKCQAGSLGCRDPVV